MKNKVSVRMLTLSLVLLMVMGLFGVAQASSTKDSDANINFAPGEFIINPPGPGEEQEHGFKALEIYFGKRKIPTRREVYVADGTVATDIGGFLPQDGIDQGGTLTPATVGVLITDSRPAPGAWDFQLKLGLFEAPSMTSFGGTLSMFDGVGYTNTNKTIGTDLVVANSGDIVLVAGALSATPVLHGTATLGPGAHGATWQNSDIQFELDANFNAIGEADYTAKLTWSAILI